MSLALVVVLCHQLGDIPEPVCVTETIPAITIMDTMMAGKVDDPQQIPWTHQVCVVSAQRIVAEWLKQSPKYIGWTPADIRCLDNFEDPHKA